MRILLVDDDEILADTHQPETLQGEMHVHDTGEMAFSDPAISAWTASHHNLHLIPPVLCALFVVAAGKWLQVRNN